MTSNRLDERHDDYRKKQIYYWIVFSCLLFGLLTVVIVRRIAPVFMVPSGFLPANAIAPKLSIFSEAMREASTFAPYAFMG